MPELSVIIPAYNEEREIASILKQLTELPLDIEIIVVDDKSTDRTIDEVKSIDSGKIRLIYHNVNSGKAEAVKTGLKYATGMYSVIQDADNEYDPRNFIPMLELIKEFNNIAVYGNRFGEGFPEGMTITQKTGNMIMTAILNIIMRTKIRDMETCYKMFRTDYIIPEDIDSRGFGIDPEITIRLLRRGVCIVEIPIKYIPRSYEKGKKIKLRDAFVTMNTIIKKGML